jgi:hypothetical protein
MDGGAGIEGSAEVSLIVKSVSNLFFMKICHASNVKRRRESGAPCRRHYQPRHQ